MSFGKPNLARALLKKNRQTPTVYSTENGYRIFMKQVNKSGGVFFEALNALECGNFINERWSRVERLLP